MARDHTAVHRRRGHRRRFGRLRHARQPGGRSADGLEAGASRRAGSARGVPRSGARYKAARRMRGGRGDPERLGVRNGADPNPGRAGWRRNHGGGDRRAHRQPCREYRRRGPCLPRRKWRMISIKKYLSTDSRETSHAYERMSLMLLEAIGLHAVEGDRADYDVLRGAIADLQTGLTEDPSPANILVTTGAAVKAIQNYNRRTSQILGARSV